MTFLNDPIGIISAWLAGLLTGLGPGWTAFILAFLGVLASAVFVLVVDILLVWVERKVVARLQDRLGPNRLGPFGLIQPLADVLKLLIKEDITPNGADKLLFNLAPIIALATVLLLWGVIPFGPRIFGTDLNVGVLYIVAVGALGTLGIIMAGWASNNKYALLGALRMVAQMVSFEVPMVLALLIPVILAGTMGINGIVKAQSIWFVLVAPLAAGIFLISAQAELGRAPFDLAEAESEIVAGFHIEYTGMKFGMFYAGELLHALTFGGIISALFLGGWRGPWAENYPILGVIYFFIKAFILYFVIMWVKYSLPRLRIDQMLNFNWKFLTPLSLALVIVTAVLSKVLSGFNITLQTSPVIYVVSFLAANLLIAVITVLILRSQDPGERPRVAEPRPVAMAPEGPASEIS
jgi:NADH-quinone oxidoreductase subunit H